MRALRLTEWKTDPSIEEVPEPDPGPGEVVIKVAAAGACHSDLHLMHEFEAGVVPWGPPFTLGHENAGWVHALGAGVSAFEVGQPVAVYGPWGCGYCSRCRVGLETYCENAAELGVAGGGLGADGGMAPYMLVPQARWLVPLGDLDPVAAAPLTDAGLTPYHAVKRALPRLGAGSTAVVIGVGGLGYMGVQILAALTSAQIIAVDQRQAALDMATSAGASHGITSDADAAGTIRDLTRGQGADVVLDFVGIDPTLALANSVVRQLGRITIVGIGGGTLAISFFGTPYEASVSTTYWGSIPELMEVIQLAREGHISPHVERYPLSEAMEAYRAMEEGRLNGRAVIIPD